MSNLRFTMKFRDQKFSWSERHWYYAGLPTITSPNIYPVSPTPSLANAQTAAAALMAARMLCLPSSVQAIGAVLSYDDSDRDGQVVTYVGNPQFTLTQNSVLNPELSYMVQMSSGGIIAGGTYQSQFYMGSIPASIAADQTLVQNSTWYTPAAAYLGRLILANQSGSTGWGWKAVMKNPPGISPVFTWSFQNTVQPWTLTLNFANPVSLPAESPIVKLQGWKQIKGASPRINGRWYVVSGNGTNSLVLSRKAFPPYTSVASLGVLAVGVLVPTVYIIVPYTAIGGEELVKHDRGGTLGLSRGRSRGKPANV